MMSKVVILFALFACALAGAVYSPAYATYSPYASYAYTPSYTPAYTAAYNPAYYGSYYGSYAPAWNYGSYYGTPAYGYGYAYAPYTSYSTILKK